MDKLRVIDISIPLNEQTPSYTGEQAFWKTRTATVAEDGYNLHTLEMNTHSGTHMDAPFHFIEQGKRLSDFPASRFVATAHVVDVTGRGVIGVDEVRGLDVHPGEAVLFHTENPACGLDTACAAWLAEKGVGMVGIDHASIEIAVNDQFPVHHILLSSEILIIEFLRLTDVAPGVYTLCALPLALTGTDGSPVRAVLISIEN